MTLEADFRCDKCGCPIFKEEKWIMLDHSKKHLCQGCILDVVNEMDELGLIDYHMTEDSRTSDESGDKNE